MTIRTTVLVSALLSTAVGAARAQPSHTMEATGTFTHCDGAIIWRERPELRVEMNMNTSELRRITEEIGPVRATMTGLYVGGSYPFFSPHRISLPARLVEREIAVSRGTGKLVADGLCLVGRAVGTIDAILPRSGGTMRVACTEVVRPSGARQLFVDRVLVEVARGARDTLESGKPGQAIRPGQYWSSGLVEGLVALLDDHRQVRAIHRASPADVGLPDLGETGCACQGAAGALPE